MAYSNHPAVKARYEPEFWYRQAHIPHRFWGMTFDDYDERMGSKETLDAVLDYATQLERGDLAEGRGLALFGLPGRGKTMLACILACEHIRRSMPTGDLHALFAFDPPARFITLADYVTLHINAIELDKWASRVPDDADQIIVDWQQNYDRRQDLRETPLLVLDDVGKEHASGSGYAESLFHSLLRHRFSQGHRTVITSNLLEADEFKRVYGPAQYSYLHEACIIVKSGGRDAREHMAPRRKK